MITSYQRERKKYDYSTNQNSLANSGISCTSQGSHYSSNEICEGNDYALELKSHLRFPWIMVKFMNPYISGMGDPKCGFSISYFSIIHNYFNLHVCPSFCPSCPMIKIFIFNKQILSSKISWMPFFLFAQCVLKKKIVHGALNDMHIINNIFKVFVVG